jgi:hypothetical protein
MDKLDIKALRRGVFSDLSEEEQEEAGRILREYLDVYRMGLFDAVALALTFLFKRPKDD